MAGRHTAALFGLHFLGVAIVGDDCHAQAGRVWRPAMTWAGVQCVVRSDGPIILGVLATKRCERTQMYGASQLLLQAYSSWFLVTSGRR